MILFYPFPLASKLHYSQVEGAYVSLDLGAMNLPKDWLIRNKQRLAQALEQMQRLEEGAIANPDENRRVGHYWLRAPEFAPDEKIRSAIIENGQALSAFVDKIHQGHLVGENGSFQNVLLIGIGGSALGPQFVSAALAGANPPMQMFFLDNTDPDGMEQVFAKLRQTQAGFAGTLVIVTSKSGGTKETKNGQIETEARFAEAGLRFQDHAVAITMPGSELAQTAIAEGWLATFPIWEWVGGRTSELSSVGLLPAALQGIDTRALLVGARDMDAFTRAKEPESNPALLLALAWEYAVERGRREMVILPYKDRLELFPKYLQQLIMESLGKEKNERGDHVYEGISVFGNKGSTDQHAYIQQLREGVNHFFVTFLGVQKDHTGPLEKLSSEKAPVFVEDQVTSGDYLLGFLLGTRQALRENYRDSLTITIPEVSPYTIGMLIALYERAVGFYAFLRGINAYHQPGVEAGKQAAASVLLLQRKLLASLSVTPSTVVEICQRAYLPGKDEAFWVLEHLAMNGRIGRIASREAPCLETKYFRKTEEFPLLS